MKLYLDALHLLEQASDKVEKAGDTLVVAHLALPISLLREKIAEKGVRPDVG